MNSDPKTLTATCAKGLESLLADELANLRGDIIEESPGAVTFSGSLETAYRACLWSRFATRILLFVAEIPAPDTDALYEGVSGVDWNEHLAVDKRFAVDCTSSLSSIQHSRFAALRAKDAVVDQFRDRFNRRPSIELERPDIRIHLFLRGETAKVSLDLSGMSLHRRGYRAAGGEAPLKETLAAAIVSLSGWQKDFPSENVLLDPMCGSGTMLIEAALIYGDIAPGLGRKYFGFLGWRGHDQALWDRLIAEAADRRKRGLEGSLPRIIGYDADPAAIRIAQENIKQAGLTGIIHVERKELAWLRNPLNRGNKGEGRAGLMVINPPYGERVGSINTARYLYRCLGRKIREEFAGWRSGIFTGHADLADALDLSPLKKYRMYNGPIPCQLRLFDIPPGRDRETSPKPPIAVQSSGQPAGDFANRLRKNLKHLSKWVNRESISCLRIYDGDIPEYNVAVDLYEHWVHVQEYAPPKTVDPEKAARRLKEVLVSLPDILGIHRNRIFVKVRHRQKGKSQYQKRDNRGRFHEVSEYNCRFLVNFTDYLDTGLFLDHRITRRMIQEEAKDRRFLNLFAYTGSATVHAVVGGAKTSTSVDLSPVYLEWARSNLALNGFSDINHKLVQGDCMSWLAKTREQFDLIFAAPPTFSNSKSTRRIFDIQRDHVALIRAAMKRLEPGGLLIFSSNFRRFKLNHEALAEYHLEDITRKTIPRDFERRPRIHQCWKILRKPH